MKTTQKKDKEELKRWKDCNGGATPAVLIKFDEEITVPLYNPKIQSEFWEPDHVEIPDLTYQFFLKENTRETLGRIEVIKQNLCKAPYKKFYVTLENWYGGREDRWNIGVQPSFRFAEVKKTLGEYFRELTEDELKKALDGYEKLLKAQEKKCENYWKRYKDKVMIRTYWADR